MNVKKRKKKKDQKEANQEKEVEVRNDPEVENEGELRMHRPPEVAKFTVRFKKVVSMFILAKVENDQEEIEVHLDQRNRNDPDDRDHVTRSVPDPVIENAIHAIRKKMAPMLKSKLLTTKSKLKHRLKIRNNCPLGPIKPAPNKNCS